MLWDGECGFCARWVDYWRELTDGAVMFVPFQQAPDLMGAYDLDEVETAQAVHLLMPDGTVYRGAEAVLRVLRHASSTRFRAYLALYHRFPTIAAICEGVYRMVAQRRVAAAKVTKLLWGRPHRETFTMAQFLFARLLAVAAFFAFWSLHDQLPGLFGAHGIFPFQDFLAQAVEWGRETGRDPQRFFPSVFWWLGAEDGMLRQAAGAGMVAAGLLFVGVAPRVMVFVLWVLYLSFMSLDQLFLNYQWDSLLLETLFVGLFFVPAGLVPRRTLAAQPGGRWLTWLLLFKLMFMAGLVKLLAPQSAWTDLSALSFHFWTQPIPNLVAPYVAALPPWVLQCGVVFTLLAETAVPLLIFAPRRARHVAAMTMIVLQVLIVMTGTYGFFNLLAIALCVSLFDDEAFARSRFTKLAPHQQSSPQGLIASAALIACVVLLLAPPSAHTVITTAVALLIPVVLVVVVIVALRADDRSLRADLRAFALAIAIPLVSLSPVLPKDARAFVAPLRTFNQYGLFASMTKDRPEVLVEWSADGAEWTAYDFHYKPTDIDEPLRRTTYHMPRLDWQMWFAALVGCQRAGWLQPFAHRLLLHTPEVHALLQGGIPAEPPRFVRMRAYFYELGEEAVWQRTERGLFCPVFTLNDTGALVPVQASQL